MSKISVSTLKKSLAKNSKADLIKEILLLYKKIPAVKEYYSMQAGDQKEILEKYKAIIEKEFVEGKTRGMPKLRFAVARKALNDFKKLTDDQYLIANLMLTYAESVSHFSSEYGPNEEKFYTLPEDMFEQVLEMAKKGGFLNKFKNRAYEMVDGACDGWGHLDSLQDTYKSYYGNFIR